MDSQLKSIEGQTSKFNDYIDNQVKKNIGDIANLDQNQFNQQLPSIAADLHTVIRQEISPDSATLRTISAKLEKAPQDHPGYWPASGALVSAKSAVGKSNSSLSEALSLPDCPRPSGVFFGVHFDADHCAVVLDGWNYTDSTFRNAVIKYRGGPLVLRNTSFVNCIFIVELPNDPAKPAQAFTRELLASSDLEKILINSA